MPRSRFTIEQLEPWIEVRFDRGSGPGGQHVNKVETRATLLFDFQACPLLTATQRAAIRRSLSTRLSADGRLRVTCQVGRSQIANRQEAGRRLVELVRSAVHVPKRRRPTRPTAASREQRLTSKRHRAATKRLRREKPRGDE